MGLTWPRRRVRVSNIDPVKPGAQISCGWWEAEQETFDGLRELPGARQTFVEVVQAAVSQCWGRLFVGGMLEMSGDDITAVPPFNHVELVDAGFEGRGSTFVAYEGLGACFS